MAIILPTIISFTGDEVTTNIANQAVRRQGRYCGRQFSLSCSKSHNQSNSKYLLLYITWGDRRRLLLTTTIMVTMTIRCAIVTNCSIARILVHYDHFIQKNFRGSISGLNDTNWYLVYDNGKYVMFLESSVPESPEMATLGELVP